MLATLERLLRHAIDYAGLFPPAALTLERVVQNYADYLTLPQRWLLGRLILPLSRLEDFDRSAERLLPARPAASPWRISCIFPPVFESADGLAIDAKQARAILRGRFAAVQMFNSHHQETSNCLAQIDAIEVSTPTVEAVEILAEAIIQSYQGALEVFCELPSKVDASFFAALKRGDRFMRAKIRTGGLDADVFPTTETVAQFLALAGRHRVPFKATAGLHHPLRGEYPLTYDRVAPQAPMHGFLNIFLAACWAFRSPANDDLEPLQSILSSDGYDFSFEPDVILWRDQVLTLQTIAEVRANFFRSFGSCSFVEPVEDLQDLGLIPLDETELRS